MTLTITSVIALTAVIIATVALIFAIIGLCIIIGLKNSTHQIAYQTVDSVVDEFQDDVDDEINEREEAQIYTDAQKKEEIRAKKVFENFSKMYDNEG